ncbi:early nodulin-like protein 2 [Durio zibethinus]|uniref:Early nodulin-like protein 2 n=1 Tax=Durio zibethinus TaxID=66656 RepID=A0A6P5Z836_DURZI|nr:early nodulin-like protein 2 [Durio zibethinus]
MGSKGFLGCLLFVIVLSFLICSTQGYKFYVGGKDGWVVSPSENYNHWAERNRFQVNDTLFFKYKKGSDSVLLVPREDYDSCNTKNPIQSLTEGDSIFTFDRSGPFFFISGNADNCNKGQKLIVVVMAVRRKPQELPPFPSPSSVVPATTPVSPPPSPVPKTNPPLESPTSSEAPADLDAPVPVPSEQKSGSLGLVRSTWLVLGSSIWLSIVMGSL